MLYVRDVTITLPPRFYNNTLHIYKSTGGSMGKESTDCESQRLQDTAHSSFGEIEHIAVL